jgi:RHS repeat-associated protein
MVFCYLGSSYCSWPWFIPTRAKRGPVLVGSIAPRNRIGFGGKSHCIISVALVSLDISCIGFTDFKSQLIFFTAVNYPYDNANRPIQVTLGSSTVFFAYDAENRLTSLTLLNGIVMSYSYDNASEFTGISYANGSTNLGSPTYGYDLAGRRTSMGGSLAQTALPLAGSEAEYNANNQLTEWGTASLYYDANGNMTSDGTNSYIWNARNQLASMDSSGYSFQYEGFGRRTGKTISGTTTNYLYDGANTVQELSGSTVAANLLTGLGVDERFARTDSSGTAKLLTDALGSTLALTNSSGGSLAQYAYEPFGNTTVTSGSSTNSYEYTGRENDGTGLQFNRGRYYSPTLQRFISEDPIGIAGGINLYAYVRNSPVGAVDPFGLWQFTVSGGWGLGGVVTVGKNGGQWSFGAYAGAGAGISVSYDPTDSGSKAPGFEGGLSGNANVGVSTMGYDVGIDSTVSIPSLKGDANVTLPVPGTPGAVTIPLPGSVDGGSPHGTVGGGAGGAIGIGGVVVLPTGPSSSGSPNGAAGGGAGGTGVSGRKG